jgi:hypothetical protein
MTCSMLSASIAVAEPAKNTRYPECLRDAND